MATVVDMTPGMLKETCLVQTYYTVWAYIAIPKSGNEHVETRMKHGWKNKSREKVPANEVCRYTTVYYTPRQRKLP